MPLKMVWNPKRLEANLLQTGEKAIKNMSDRARKVMVKVRDLAREYAPVKTGLLEKNIDYLTTRGVNGRHVFTVYIDEDASRFNGEGELGEYADIMEKQLRPHGRVGKAYHLGPKSQEKAASGKKVGGRFLGRAVDEAAKNLFPELVAEVRRATGAARIANVNYRRAAPDDE